jgi:hypothetical protein
MDEAERARLKAKGWVETTVQELLGLDDAEMAMIELRIRLTDEVTRRRKKAARLQAVGTGPGGSKPIRVAKKREDLLKLNLHELIAAYLATGASLADLAAVVASAGSNLEAMAQRP